MLLIPFVSSLLVATGSCIPFNAVPARSEHSLSCPSANNTVYVAGSTSWEVECFDRSGGDMPSPNGQYAATLKACIALCIARTGCILVDWVPGPKACYVKSSVGAMEPNAGVWGARLVSESTSTPVNQASSAAASASAYVASSVVNEITPSLSSPSPTISSSVTPATSTSAAPPASTSLAPNTVGKRGLAFNNAADTVFFGGSGSKVTWVYNWYSDHNGSSVDPSLTYIPMLWGADSARTSIWSADANYAITQGADTLLAFNEPDSSTQSNLDVLEAVSAYKSYMQPFAGRARLGAPAVTNGGAPMGLTYLENFIGNCTGCTIDVVPIHWYDSATNIGYFQWYIPTAYAAGGNRPLWITEFGASGTDAEIENFFNTVLPWLDSLSYVERYAYFYDGPSTSSVTYLVNEAGTAASDVGSMYNSL